MLKIDRFNNGIDNAVQHLEKQTQERVVQEIMPTLSEIGPLFDKVDSIEKTDNRVSHVEKNMGKMVNDFNRFEMDVTQSFNDDTQEIRNELQKFMEGRRLIV